MNGTSYSGPQIITPIEEPKIPDEFAMNDADVIQWEDPEHLPATAIPVRSPGLAPDEQHEHQEELFQGYVSPRLQHALTQPEQPEVVTIQSQDYSPASPRVSSED
jgi:hypothetical protein